MLGRGGGCSRRGGGRGARRRGGGRGGRDRRQSSSSSSLKRLIAVRNILSRNSVACVGSIGEPFAICLAQCASILTRTIAQIFGEQSLCLSFIWLLPPSVRVAEASPSVV